MEDKIKDASLSFTCNQDWNAMKPEAEGRFCATCQKKVYDMTDKNTAYFVRILAENNNKVCGRFTSNQLSISAPSHKPYWKKWAIAAMVFIGFNTASEKTKAQEIMGKVAPKQLNAGDDFKNSPLMGEVVISRPAEYKELHAYLARKVKVPATVNGGLIASFTVAKDGSLTNIAVSEQLTPEVRTAVAKVLKTAPRGKDTQLIPGYPYSLFLTFKNGKIMPYPTK